MTLSCSDLLHTCTPEKRNTLAAFTTRPETKCVEEGIAVLALFDSDLAKAFVDKSAEGGVVMTHISVLAADCVAAAAQGSCHSKILSRLAFGCQMEIHLRILLLSVRVRCMCMVWTALWSYLFLVIYPPPAFGYRCYTSFLGDTGVTCYNRFRAGDCVPAHLEVGGVL